MEIYQIYGKIEKADVMFALRLQLRSRGMFRKKTEKKPYDKRNKKAVLRCSICTGEQVAGFKNLNTGHFEEIMLIKDSRDLDDFMEMYDVAEITKEY